MENLENVLESILFVNGDAVDIADITSKLDVSKADIKNAVKKLKEKYTENGIWDELLKEVTNIVEWPHPVLGNFDEKYCR